MKFYADAARKIFFVVILYVLTGPVWALSFNQIIVFGDSLTDTGNVYALSGGAGPQSPPYYQGRFSNGPNWIDQFESYYGQTAAPSLQGGLNFAFGGAETGFGSSSLSTPNIGAQVTMALSSPTVIQLLPDSLVVLWGGANDFLNAGRTNAAVPVANLSADINRLAAAGADTFMVLNLPPLGQTPFYIGTSQEIVLDQLAVDFNNLLAPNLSNLAVALGVEIIQVDIYELFDNMLSNPAAYGFTNIADRALMSGYVSNIPPPYQIAPNPEEYVFWDFVHPTTVAHSIIGSYAQAVLPEPNVLALMIGGLIVLGFRLKHVRPLP